jgi:hypothetical protein
VREARWCLASKQRSKQPKEATTFVLGNTVNKQVYIVALL